MPPPLVARGRPLRSRPLTPDSNPKGTPSATRRKPRRRRRPRSQVGRNGACNPPLAHRALQAEPDLGVFLPCNVVVYDAPDGTHVSAIDPQSMLAAIDNPVLDEIAADVRERFGRVVAALS